MRINGRDRLNVIKEQIRELNAYNGTEKVVRKYKNLIERFPDNLRKRLAIDKSPVVVQVFEQVINSGVVNDASKGEFDPTVAEDTVRALEMLGRLIGRFSNETVSETYLQTIETIGYLATMRCPTPDGGALHLRKETLLSILDKSLEKMENGELGKLENTVAKLEAVAWSAGSAGRVILHLEANRIPDMDENGVRRLYNTRDELVEAYLDREVLPLGTNGDIEDEKRIRRVLEKLDGEIRSLIENNAYDQDTVKSIIETNRNLSEFMAEDLGRLPEINARLMKDGIDGLKQLLEEIEIVMY
jgi:hypothetical protein